MGDPKTFNLFVRNLIIIYCLEIKTLNSVGFGIKGIGYILVNTLEIKIFLKPILNILLLESYRRPVIAYVLLCEDQVECTACGISQMNQTRIETSNQRQLDLTKIEYLKY